MQLEPPLSEFWRSIILSVEEIKTIVSVCIITKLIILLCIKPIRSGPSTAMQAHDLLSLFLQWSRVFIWPNDRSTVAVPKNRCDPVGWVWPGKNFACRKFLRPIKKSMKPWLVDIMINPNLQNMILKMADLECPWSYRHELRLIFRHYNTMPGYVASFSGTVVYSECSSQEQTTEC